MNSPFYHVPSGRLASKGIRPFALRLCWAAVVVILAAASTASAQIASINSAVVVPRVFNDAPSATLAYSNNYPATISIRESNVVAAVNKFANRDIWYYSTNGTAPYQFHSNDYFYATFSATLTGGIPGLDLEAGIIFSDPSGVWGGDLQSIITAGGVVAQFGGPSYYPFSPAAGGYPGKGGAVSNYVEGETYTFGINYLKDPATGHNAFQYSVNGQYAASSVGDPYFDIGTNAIGHPGDYLGGYLQVQRGTNLPGNFGTVVFSDISINPAVAPGITCPAPVEVDCPQPAELTAQVDNASGLPLDVVWAVNGTAVQTNALPATKPATVVPVLFSASLPLGTNAVAVSVSDAYANQASCATTVTVVDTNPPVIVSASATPDVLWPPLHQLVPVEVTASVTDPCDSADWMIVAVSSNEPGQGHGPDWIITGPHSLLLRAERLGYKPRIYWVTIQATDTSGNVSAPKVIMVTVPRSAEDLPRPVGQLPYRSSAISSPDQQ